MSDILHSKRTGFVLATTVKAFVGRYSKWEQGEKVKAWLNEDGTYTIERVRWTGSLVPLWKSCYGVPKRVFSFKK